MKLYYHRNKDGIPNFGDDLNPWMWDRILPTVLDDDAELMFVGIGTLLNDRLPAARRRVIMGAGFGIGAPPAVDSSWTFYAVRGPLSAKALQLSRELGVTDPAVLASLLVRRAAGPPRFKFAYMPHYRNACAGWQRACERVGFGYIDPRSPVDDVLAAIQDTEVLLAEAMHGAIMADTLRVPWIPVKSREKILRFKWEDWCASLEVEYRPEAIISLWEPRSTVDQIRAHLKGQIASVQLLRAARAAPALSTDTVFHDRLDRYTEIIDVFRRDVRDGRFRTTNRLASAVPRA